MKSYRKWVIHTRSGSEYVLTRFSGSTEAWWRITARKAEGKGARLLDKQYAIQVPEFPKIGEGLLVYGADDTFPASSGWLITSRVSRITEVL